MSYKPSDIFYTTLITHNPLGFLSSADSTPTASLKHNGSITGTSVTITANSTYTTGCYDVSFTIPSGYSAGDTLELIYIITTSGIIDIQTSNIIGLDSSRFYDVTIGSVDVNAKIDLTQSVPTTNTAQTLGDCLNAARAQGFGKWVVNGTNLSLYAPDGTTIIRSFTLDSASAPTQRT